MELTAYDCAPMRTQPLPRQVDARKLAAAGTEIRASERVSEFPRFVAGLLSDLGDVAVELHFHVDRQGLHRLDGHVLTEVSVTCQRCMQPMSLTLDSAFHVGLVWGESQLQTLPRELESVVMDSDTLDVLPLVEDELIVAMPIVAFHDEADCEGAASVQFPPPQEAQGNDEQRENPFAVLEKLKSDKRD